MDVFSASELASISADTWAATLGVGALSAQLPAAPEPPPRLLLGVGETACLKNSDAHFAFSRVKLFTPEEDSSDASSTSSASSVTYEAPRPAALPIALRLKPSEYFARFVSRTPEQCAAELAAPQRSPAWLLARSTCITASQFGAAAGESPYQSPDALVGEKLWSTFRGNAMTEWGNEHEPHAAEAFCGWFGAHLRARGLSGEFRLREENLLKFSDAPWIAVSPDGIVEYTDERGEHVQELVEFKCPALLRNTRGHPYAKWPANTPRYYYAQIQGIMGHLNAHRWRLERCWFVAWQPHQTWITLHAYDARYYDDQLLPRLREWFFARFLPRLAHKHNGLLAHGETDPQEELELP